MYWWNVDVSFDMVGYVSHKKEFYEFHHEALWELLRLHSISANIVSSLTGLYSETKCCDIGWGVQLLWSQVSGRDTFGLHHILKFVWNEYKAELWTKVIVGNLSANRVIDHIFVIDVIIHAESLEVLVSACKGLHEEAYSLTSPGPIPRYMYLEALDDSTVCPCVW